MSSFSCLELFAGAGGLAHGLSSIGIDYKGLIEWNPHAYQTLCQQYNNNRVFCNDVREVNFREFGSVDLIAGGPPCQPFSLGGKHRGYLDSRDMFPWACEAIATCTPKAFVFENVKGLLRQSFRTYFNYILLRLKYPQIRPKTTGDWQSHHAQLKQIDRSPLGSSLQYRVYFKLVDTADYGIPQRRERVILVGIRQDIAVDWSFPKPSHSLDALLWCQFVTQTYWEHHNVQPPPLDHYDCRLQKRIKTLQRQPPLFPSVLEPWKTVRDAIATLPYPDATGTFHPDHYLRDGAKSYPGHTGSYIDLPSKALKAGDHGVPGGENMIRYRDGQVRYYTILEAKRIQTFPDHYSIVGSWTEAMRQLGNAVPVDLGRRIGQSLATILSESSSRSIHNPVITQK